MFNKYKGKKPTRRRKMWEALKRKARKARIALAFAGALLAVEPAMVRAQEEPIQKPKLEMKLGAAYDYKEKEARALMLLGSELPLPLQMKLAGLLGFSASLSDPGAASLEEFKLNFNIPVAGPVSVDLYGYNSRHLGVQTFSAGGDVCIGLPFGAVIVAFENIFDANQRPLLGILVLDAIKDRLSISLSGGWTTNTGAGITGGGLTVNLGKDLPAVGVHTIMIYTSDAVIFVDTRAMLEWKF